MTDLAMQRSPLGAAGWLHLAATPTFALMALVTAMSGGDVLCAAMGASPLAGMVPMYLLMSVFHAAPWLRLIAGRDPAARRPFPEGDRS